MDQSSHIPPHRIIAPFTPEEAHEIQERLDTKLEASHLSYRPAAQGTVAYLEGWKAFNLANEVFGFNGWSSEILSFSIDFTDIDANGKISLGMSCMVRIHLKDGTYHDDIGYGSADNQKSKSAAYEKAKKEAVTDGMKRALRMFGNRLGNCAYDKTFLKNVKNSRPAVTAQVSLANYPSTTASNAKTIQAPIQNNVNTATTTVAPIAEKASSNVAPRSSFEESMMFDNSMMISEEDLIIDDNFAHLADDAVIMEFDENSVMNNYNNNTNTNNYNNSTSSDSKFHQQNPGTYPILPNKRR